MKNWYAATLFWKGEGHHYDNKLVVSTNERTMRVQGRWYFFLFNETGCTMGGNTAL